MRTTPALRTLTAALFTGGILAVPVGTAAAQGDSGGRIRGTVVSAGDLNLRRQPTTDSPVVGRLAPGSHDRVECSVVGQTVRGNPH